MSHGWTFLKQCRCAKPGKTYMRGRNKLTLFDDGTAFKLVRIGNVITIGNANDLEYTLNTYGL
jgi:hypothetical protein